MTLVQATNRNRARSGQPADKTGGCRRNTAGSVCATSIRLLNIAVIGAGPTGVELFASIAELSRYTLARNFRSINSGSAQIALIEAPPRLLGGFSEESSTYAKARLERLSVQLRTGEIVEDAGLRQLSSGAVRSLSGW